MALNDGTVARGERHHQHHYPVRHQQQQQNYFNQHLYHEQQQPQQQQQEQQQHYNQFHDYHASMQRLDGYPTALRSEMDNSASFLRAARAGNLDKVLEYLKGSIDINTSNANGLNALHLASKEGHVAVVAELVSRGAAVNAATRKGNTALHIASLAGRTEVVKTLIESGGDVNAQSQNGFTPLYMAAQENHDAVVRLLLASNASQSLATEDGFTPLAVALQQGHDKVVAVLLENDARGKVRLPALHIAAKKDDTKAAGLLLQTHEHNPDVTSKSGFTPLHIAAHYGNANIAALLLEKGADVNFPAKHQITPLHVAAKWGKANMVKLLLDNGAKLDASTRDGLTPLHCAARSGHDQVVEQLIDKGAPITAKTKNGLAPLHMASQGDHVDSAKILLNHKAPVDDVTVDYLTALHVAAHCGHVAVAKLLLEKKADANSRALNGFTPLHIACKKNRIKVVELLLRHGASIEATTESGLTPLHVASFMGCMNIVIYLIQHGANADVPTVRGETPLHLAARANQTDIVRILLRNGAHVDARARENQTPLHIAARLGNADAVGLLLQHGAHVDSATNDEYTALHIAAKEGQDDVIGTLLDHGASVTATTKKGFTPLHLAAKYGQLRAARHLLAKDAPVDAQGKNGVTPLHVAAHYDHNDVALLLLEQGASPHAAAKNGYTPLHIAAKKNQMDIESTLIKYGAKTNAESKAGFTPLHLAAQEGHVDMATALVDHGAATDAAARNGLTPLHLAAQENRVAVARLLLDRGAAVAPATAAGYTPLHVACHFGQAHVAELLLERGADANATTTHGYTPLHQAAQQGHMMIVGLLLANRARPNATTNQGQTALSIAQRLGYISVIESLRSVTETTVTTTTTIVTEEKYKVLVPETMHETFMSDSEDEPEQDNMMGDHSFKYLTADEMKSLGDDSLPIDVTRDERLHEAHVAHVTATQQQQQAAIPSMLAQEEDRLSPSHLDQSFAKAAPDNVEVKRTPIHAGGEGKLKWKTFLVSFMVDARGGAMRGCRHSGVRVIIPPRRASMPMRITCRFVRKERLAHPPPLMEGEACAARVIEMGPAGARFLGPVVIEVPHFASLRGNEREIVVLRSDNGEAWKEHTAVADGGGGNVTAADDAAIADLLNGSFDAQELNAMQDFNTSRVTRILTTDFPQYFAVVCRNRQEVHSIGPEGGMVSSTVVPQVQAIFPDGALTKKIKVGLQAQPIHPEMVSRLLGNRVAVSPIVTVEPRRRKFHKPITLTIPLPRAAHKGMTNQYSSDAPTLRLLCSITGGQTKAQWEDVTGSTPLTFVNDCVSFTTTVSARFWLIDCRQVNDVTKFASELYQEAVLVPFMAKFVVFAKRHEPQEAQLRVFCMTDDREDKTLESQEHFSEVAKSRDVEVLEGTQQYLEFAGNLVPITKSGEQLALTFEAFKENRVAFNARVKDMHLEPIGRVAFMKEPRGKSHDAPQTPVCNLNINLPDPVLHESIPLEKKYGFIQSGFEPHELIHRADLHLSDIAKELGSDWPILARQLNLPSQEIQQIKDEVPKDRNQQALIMLRIWIQRMGPAATGNSLEKALQNIGRSDIVRKCMSNVEVVTDDVERAVAKVHLSRPAYPSVLGDAARTTVITASSIDERDITKDAESAEDTSSVSATKARPTAVPAPVVHATTVLKSRRDEFFGITRGLDQTPVGIRSSSSTTTSISSGPARPSAIQYSTQTFNIPSNQTGNFRQSTTTYLPKVEKPERFEQRASASIPTTLPSSVSHSSTKPPLFYSIDRDNFSKSADTRSSSFKPQTKEKSPVFSKKLTQTSFSTTYTPLDFGEKLKSPILYSASKFATDKTTDYGQKAPQNMFTEKPDHDKEWFQTNTSTGRTTLTTSDANKRPLTYSDIMPAPRLSFSPNQTKSDVPFRSQQQDDVKDISSVSLSYADTSPNLGLNNKQSQSYTAVKTTEPAYFVRKTQASLFKRFDTEPDKKLQPIHHKETHPLNEIDSSKTASSHTDVTSARPKPHEYKQTVYDTLFKHKTSESLKKSSPNNVPVSLSSPLGAANAPAYNSTRDPYQRGIPESKFKTPKSTFKQPSPEVFPDGRLVSTTTEYTTSAFRDLSKSPKFQSSVPSAPYKQTEGVQEVFVSSPKSRTEYSTEKTFTTFPKSIGTVPQYMPSYNYTTYGNTTTPTTKAVDNSRNIVGQYKEKLFEPVKEKFEEGAVSVLYSGSARRPVKPTEPIKESSNFTSKRKFFETPDHKDTLSTATFLHSKTKVTDCIQNRPYSVNQEASRDSNKQFHSPGITSEGYDSFSPTKTKSIERSQSKPSSTYRDTSSEILKQQYLSSTVPSPYAKTVPTNTNNTLRAQKAVDSPDKGKTQHTLEQQTASNTVPATYVGAAYMPTKMTARTPNPSSPSYERPLAESLTQYTTSKTTPLSYTSNTPVGKPVDRNQGKKDSFKEKPSETLKEKYMKTTLFKSTALPSDETFKIFNKDAVVSDMPKKNGDSKQNPLDMSSKEPRLASFMRYEHTNVQPSSNALSVLSAVRTPMPYSSTGVTSKLSDFRTNKSRDSLGVTPYQMPGDDCSGHSPTTGAEFGGAVPITYESSVRYGTNASVDSKKNPLSYSPVDETLFLIKDQITSSGRPASISPDHANQARPFASSVGKITAAKQRSSELSAIRTPLPYGATSATVTRFGECKPMVSDRTTDIKTDHLTGKASTSVIMSTPFSAGAQPSKPIFYSSEAAESTKGMNSKEAPSNLLEGYATGSIRVKAPASKIIGSDISNLVSPFNVPATINPDTQLATKSQSFAQIPKVGATRSNMSYTGASFGPKALKPVAKEPLLTQKVLEKTKNDIPHNEKAGLDLSPSKSVPGTSSAHRTKPTTSKINEQNLMSNQNVGNVDSFQRGSPVLSQSLETTSLYKSQVPLKSPMLSSANILEGVRSADTKQRASKLSAVRTPTPYSNVASTISSYGDYKQRRQTPLIVESVSKRTTQARLTASNDNPISNNVLTESLPYVSDQLANNKVEKFSDLESSNIVKKYVSEALGKNTHGNNQVAFPSSELGSHVAAPAVESVGTTTPHAFAETQKVIKELGTRINPMPHATNNLSIQPVALASLSSKQLEPNRSSGYKAEKPPSHMSELASSSTTSIISKMPTILSKPVSQIPLHSSAASDRLGSQGQVSGLLQSKFTRGREVSPSSPLGSLIIPEKVSSGVPESSPAYKEIGGKSTQLYSRPSEIGTVKNMVRHFSATETSGQTKTPKKMSSEFPPSGKLYGCKPQSLSYGPSETLTRSSGVASASSPNKGGAQQTNTKIKDIKENISQFIQKDNISRKIAGLDSGSASAVPIRSDPSLSTSMHTPDITYSNVGKILPARHRTPESPSKEGSTFDHVKEKIPIRSIVSTAFSEIETTARGPVSYGSSNTAKAADIKQKAEDRHPMKKSETTEKPTQISSALSVSSTPKSPSFHTVGEIGVTTEVLSKTADLQPSRTMLGGEHRNRNNQVKASDLDSSFYDAPVATQLPELKKDVDVARIVAKKDKDSKEDKKDEKKSSPKRESAAPRKESPRKERKDDLKKETMILPKKEDPSKRDKDIPANKKEDSKAGSPKKEKTLKREGSLKKEIPTLKKEDLNKKDSDLLVKKSEQSGKESGLKREGSLKKETSGSTKEDVSTPKKEHLRKDEIKKEPQIKKGDLPTSNYAKQISPSAEDAKIMMSLPLKSAETAIYSQNDPCAIDEPVMATSTSTSHAIKSEYFKKVQMPQTMATSPKRSGTPVDELSAELLEQIVKDDQELISKGMAPKKKKSTPKRARDVVDVGPGGVMGRNIEIEQYIKETVPEEVVIPQYRQETRTVTAKTTSKEGVIGELGEALKDLDSTVPTVVTTMRRTAITSQAQPSHSLPVSASGHGLARTPTESNSKIAASPLPSGSAIAYTSGGTLETVSVENSKSQPHHSVVEVTAGRPMEVHEARRPDEASAAANGQQRGLPTSITHETHEVLPDGTVVQRTVTKVTTTSFLKEGGQPLPMEISTSKQHESEAAASDADTSQVSVSSLPEDEGTALTGPQHHLQGAAEKRSKEEDYHEEKIEAMTFVQKQEYFENLSTDVNEVHLPLDINKDLGGDQVRESYRTDSQKPLNDITQQPTKPQLEVTDIKRLLVKTVEGDREVQEFVDLIKQERQVEERASVDHPSSPGQARIRAFTREVGFQNETESVHAVEPAKLLAETAVDLAKPIESQARHVTVSGDIKKDDVSSDLYIAESRLGSVFGEQLYTCSPGAKGEATLLDEGLLTDITSYERSLLQDGFAGSAMPRPTAKAPVHRTVVIQQSRDSLVMQEAPDQPHEDSYTQDEPSSLPVAFEKDILITDDTNIRQSDKTETMHPEQPEKNLREVNLEICFTEAQKTTDMLQKVSSSATTVPGDTVQSSSNEDSSVSAEVCPSNLTGNVEASSTAERFVSQETDKLKDAPGLLSEVAGRECPESIAHSPRSSHFEEKDRGYLENLNGKIVPDPMIRPSKFTEKEVSSKALDFDGSSRDSVSHEFAFAETSEPVEASKDLKKVCVLTKEAEDQKSSCRERVDKNTALHDGKQETYKNKQVKQVPDNSLSSDVAFDDFPPPEEVSFSKNLDPLDRDSSPEDLSDSQSKMKSHSSDACIDSIQHSKNASFPSIGVSTALGNLSIPEQTKNLNLETQIKAEYVSDSVTRDVQMKDVVPESAQLKDRGVEGMMPAGRVEAKPTTDYCGASSISASHKVTSTDSNTSKKTDYSLTQFSPASEASEITPGATLEPHEYATSDTRSEKAIRRPSEELPEKVEDSKVPARKDSADELQRSSSEARAKQPRDVQAGKVQYSPSGEIKPKVADTEESEPKGTISDQFGLEDTNTPICDKKVEKFQENESNFQQPSTTLQNIRPVPPFEPQFSKPHLPKIDSADLKSLVSPIDSTELGISTDYKSNFKQDCSRIECEQASAVVADSSSTTAVVLEQKEMPAANATPKNVFADFPVSEKNIPVTAAFRDVDSPVPKERLLLETEHLLEKVPIVSECEQIEGSNVTDTTKRFSKFLPEASVSATPVSSKIFCSPTAKTGKVASESRFTTDSPGKSNEELEGKWPQPGKPESNVEEVALHHSPSMKAHAVNLVLGNVDKLLHQEEYLEVLERSLKDAPNADSAAQSKKEPCSIEFTAGNQLSTSENIVPKQNQKTELSDRTTMNYCEDLPLNKLSDSVKTNVAAEIIEVKSQVKQDVVKEPDSLQAPFASLVSTDKIESSGLDSSDVSTIVKKKNFESLSEEISSYHTRHSHDPAWGQSCSGPDSQVDEQTRSGELSKAFVEESALHMSPSMKAHAVELTICDENKLLHQEEYLQVLMQESAKPHLKETLQKDEKSAPFTVTGISLKSEAFNKKLSPETNDKCKLKSDVDLSQGEPQGQRQLHKTAICSERQLYIENDCADRLLKDATSELKDSKKEFHTVLKFDESTESLNSENANESFRVPCSQSFTAEYARSLHKKAVEPADETCALAPEKSNLSEVIVKSDERPTRQLTHVDSHSTQSPVHLSPSMKAHAVTLVPDTLDNLLHQEEYLEIIKNNFEDESYIDNGQQQIVTDKVSFHTKPSIHGNETDRVSQSNQSSCQAPLTTKESNETCLPSAADHALRKTVPAYPAQKKCDSGDEKSVVTSHDYKVVNYDIKESSTMKAHLVCAADENVKDMPLLGEISGVPQKFVKEVGLRNNTEKDSSQGTKFEEAASQAAVLFDDNVQDLETRKSSIISKRDDKHKGLSFSESSYVFDKAEHVGKPVASREAFSPNERAIAEGSDVQATKIPVATATTAAELAKTASIPLQKTSDEITDFEPNTLGYFPETSLGDLLNAKRASKTQSPMKTLVSPDAGSEVASRVLEEASGVCPDRDAIQQDTAQIASHDVQQHSKQLQDVAQSHFTNLEEKMSKEHVEYYSAVSSKELPGTISTIQIDSFLPEKKSDLVSGSSSEMRRKPITADGCAVPKALKNNEAGAKSSTTDTKVEGVAVLEGQVPAELPFDETTETTQGPQQQKFRENEPSKKALGLPHVLADDKTTEQKATMIVQEIAEKAVEIVSHLSASKGAPESFNEDDRCSSPDTESFIDHDKEPSFSERDFAGRKTVIEHITEEDEPLSSSEMALEIVDKRLKADVDESPRLKEKTFLLTMNDFNSSLEDEAMEAESVGSSDLNLAKGSALCAESEDRLKETSEKDFSLFVPRSQDPIGTASDESRSTGNSVLSTAPHAEGNRAAPAKDGDEVTSRLSKTPSSDTSASELQKSSQATADTSERTAALEAQDRLLSHEKRQKSDTLISKTFAQDTLEDSSFLPAAEFEHPMAFENIAFRDDGVRIIDPRSGEPHFSDTDACSRFSSPKTPPLSAKHAQNFEESVIPHCAFEHLPQQPQALHTLSKSATTVTHAGDADQMESMSVEHLRTGTITASAETLTVTGTTHSSTTSVTTSLAGSSDTVHFAPGFIPKQGSKDESTISQDITQSGSMDESDDIGDEEIRTHNSEENSRSLNLEYADVKASAFMRPKKDCVVAANPEEQLDELTKRQSYLSEDSSEKGDSEQRPTVTSSSEPVSSSTTTTTHTSITTDYDTASQGSKKTVTLSTTSTYKTALASAQSSTVSDSSDHSTNHFSTATMGPGGELSDASDTILESPIGPVGDQRQLDAFSQKDETNISSDSKDIRPSAMYKQSPPKELVLSEAASYSAVPQQCGRTADEMNSPMEELLRRYPYGLPSTGVTDATEGSSIDDEIDFETPSVFGNVPKRSGISESATDAVSLMRKKRLSPILDDHGSTPDADSASIKRSLGGRGSERDDMSVCSLQEFERLEAEMAASKNSVASSVESSTQLQSAGGTAIAVGSLPVALAAMTGAGNHTGTLALSSPHAQSYPCSTGPSDDLSAALGCATMPADFEKLEREIHSIESQKPIVHSGILAAAGPTIVPEGAEDTITKESGDNISSNGSSSSGNGAGSINNVIPLARVFDDGKQSAFKAIDLCPTRISSCSGDEFLVSDYSKVEKLDEQNVVHHEDMSVRDEVFHLKSAVRPEAKTSSEISKKAESKISFRNKEQDDDDRGIVPDSVAIEGCSRAVGQTLTSTCTEQITIMSSDTAPESAPVAKIKLKPLNTEQDVDERGCVTTARIGTEVLAPNTNVQRTIAYKRGNNDVVTQITTKHTKQRSEEQRETEEQPGIYGDQSQRKQLCSSNPADGVFSTMHIVTAQEEHQDTVFPSIGGPHQRFSVHQPGGGSTITTTIISNSSEQPDSGLFHSDDEAPQSTGVTKVTVVKRQIVRSTPGLATTHHHQVFENPRMASSTETRQTAQKDATNLDNVAHGAQEMLEGLSHQTAEPNVKQATVTTSSTFRDPREPFTAISTDAKLIQGSQLLDEMMAATGSLSATHTSVTTRTVTETEYDSEGNPHEKTVTITTTRKVTTDKDGKQTVEETETRS